MVLTVKTTMQRLFVKDQSYVGLARRTAREFAQERGIHCEELEKLCVLVSEIGTNLAKHAGCGGEILLSDASDEKTKRILLFAVDRGPGIEDLENMLIDGVSSTCTLGAGLGTIRRMSETFEISSTPEKGTVIAVSVAAKEKNCLNARPLCNNSGLELGYVCVPHPKESNCGDAVSFESSVEMTSIMLIDSLGHGDAAAEASQIASAVFQEDPFLDPLILLDHIHKAMHGSRGAAIALAQIYPKLNKLSYVGVGNITSKICLKYENKGCASVQGIVGGQMSSPKKLDYDWTEGATLIMYSDGIKSITQEQLCSSKSAYLLAAEIYRDYSRQNDDASVVIVRDKRSK